MKKFKFNLEPVLKVRKHKVDNAKNELAKVLAEKQKRQNLIDENLNEIKQLQNKGAISDITFLQNRFNRIQLLEMNNQKIQHEIDNIIEIENLRRRELTNLMRDEKVIEKLKDKKKADYNYKINKEENEFIDEIASRNFKNL